MKEDADKTSRENLDASPRPAQEQQSNARMLFPVIVVNIALLVMLVLEILK